MREEREQNQVDQVCQGHGHSFFEKLSRNFFWLISENPIWKQGYSGNSDVFTFHKMNTFDKLYFFRNLTAQTICLGIQIKNPKNFTGG